MVEDHSQSERGNPLPAHGLLFPTSSNDSFIYIIQHHTTTFVTPVVEHWLEWEIAQWVHPMKYWSDDPSHHERTLLPQSYISLWLEWEIAQWVHSMKDRSDDPSHHVWMLLPRSYISLWLEWEIAQWVHHEGPILRPIATWANALTAELHLAPWFRRLTY